MTRCIICHRTLKDERSIRLGVGPECRQAKSRKALAYQIKSQRTAAFESHKPVTLEAVYKYTRKGWTRDGKRFEPDAEFGKYLLRYNLILPGKKE
jgi:hypothetical protein